MQNKLTSSTLAKISDRDLSFILKAYESIVLLKSLNNCLDILPRSDLYKIIARFALANLGAATQSLSYECTTEIYPNLSNLLFAKTQGSVNTAWWSNDRFALAHTLNISEMLVDIDANFGEELKAANLVFDALKKILIENKSRLKNFSMPQNFKLIDVNIDLSKYFPTYDITDVRDCLDFLKKVSALKISDTRSILLAVGFEILGNCISLYSAELEKVSVKKEIRLLRNKLAHEGSVVSCIKTNYASYLSMLSDFDGVIPAKTAPVTSEPSASAVEVDPANNASKKPKKKTKAKPANSSNSSLQKRNVNQIWSSENDLSVGIDPKLFEAIKEFKKQFPEVKPEDGLYNREFFTRIFYNAAAGSNLQVKDDDYNFQLFSFMYCNFLQFVDFSLRVSVFRVDLDSKQKSCDSPYDLKSFIAIHGMSLKYMVHSFIVNYYHTKLIGYNSRYANSLRDKLYNIAGEKGFGLQVLDAISLFAHPTCELRLQIFARSHSDLNLGKIVNSIHELINIEDGPDVLNILRSYEKIDDSHFLSRTLRSKINDGFLNAIDSNAPTKWDASTPFWVYMISEKFPCLDLRMSRDCDFDHVSKKEMYNVDVRLNFFAAWVNYRLSYISAHNIEEGALENEAGTNTPKAFAGIERKVYPVIKDRAYSLFLCDSGLLSEICDSNSEMNKGKSHGLISYLALRLDYLEKMPIDCLYNFPLFREIFEKLYLLFFMWNEIIKMEEVDVLIDLIHGEVTASKLMLLKKELPQTGDRRFKKLANKYGFSENITLLQAIVFILPDEVLMRLNPASALVNALELEKTSLPVSIQEALRIVDLKKSNTGVSSTALSTQEELSEKTQQQRYEFLSQQYKKGGEEALKRALEIEKLLKSKLSEAKGSESSSSTDMKPSRGI